MQAAKPTAVGDTWTGTPSLGSGDTGVLLYLLYAASAFQNDSYRKLAERAGENILSLAQRDKRGGVRWIGVPGASLPGMPADTYFPDFELGTAGVSYGLARLYSETNNPRFLEPQSRALHLQKIATVKADSALVFYREPDKTDLYYLGFCHGPSGTGRLFYELYKVTKDREYLDWKERFARGVRASGIPEKLAPGFWNVVCQCCGSAGVTEFFLGLWAETGYMIGAAGEGTALLQVHLAERAPLGSDSASRESIPELAQQLASQSSSFAHQVGHIAFVFLTHEFQ